MNKAELAMRLAERAHLSRKDAEQLVGQMLEIMTDALSNEERVQLVGFGSFEVKHCSAHQGRDWKTGEGVFVPPSRCVQFRAGKKLRDAMK